MSSWVYLIVLMQMIIGSTFVTQSRSSTSDQNLPCFATPRKYRSSFMHWSKGFCMKWYVNDWTHLQALIPFYIMIKSVTNNGVPTTAFIFHFGVHCRKILWLNSMERSCAMCWKSIPRYHLVYFKKTKYIEISNNNE